MSYKRINLNGDWELEPGADKPDTWHYQVEVPGLVDVAKPKLVWGKYEYFWYRKEFRLPGDTQFENIYLQLEQVKYGTDIWLNGQHVGGDIPCYTSQEFDLTSFINRNGTNILLVRVGAKSTLPEKSAVGNDFEKISFIPGIWGDVYLHLLGAGRAKWTRIIPDINKGTISIYSEIQNLSGEEKYFDLEYQLTEKENGSSVIQPLTFHINAPPYSTSVNQQEVKLPNHKLWSPENPFLYSLKTMLRDKNSISHSADIHFGMREFKIHDGSFYLNGKRRVLLGSNIAFHRLLSDSIRGTLPWNRDWIKKVLVDIPKQHNMFFFRFHLGHAYKLWYDIADENGIMLQDEWMFWTSSGTPDQIAKEFKAWIRENINHPSIVIWDALNESQDTTITRELIPKLKNDVDPTRPWEIVDFEEDHPYIYSLGPVLNEKKFGYSRSIFDLQNSTTPTMVNEFLWWWLDINGDPTNLTEIVKERWLGKNPAKEQLLEHQAFLASELTELWRRLDLDAILPFIYLSISGGATANWFLGALNELQPKPILTALKNAFSPLGVSIELWDRHFLPGEKREIQVYIFNDSHSMSHVKLEGYFANKPSKTIFSQEINLSEGEHKQIEIKISFPETTGEDWLIARILDDNGNEIAFSRKLLHVFSPQRPSNFEEHTSISIYDPASEISRFLQKLNIILLPFPKGIENTSVVLINGKGIENIDKSLLPVLTDFVEKGGILILQEPEYEVENEIEYTIVENLELHVQYRKDPERGGYDSYVFPGDNSHFLWRNINPELLKMFNGALGGEIISQYNVRPNIPYNAGASCNLSLKVPAVLEIPYGKGWVIISRIQVRGRLLPEESSSALYGRRYDPVAEQYFRNLITGYLNKEEYHDEIQKRLAETKFYIARVRASSGQIYDALDGKMTTRWASKMEDPQWVWIDFGRDTKIQKLTIHWETAFGKEYEIYKSSDNENWELIFKETDSDGGKDEIDFDELETRYFRIDFKKRGTQWGYSIWEMEFE
jgi:hypothetical protein